MKNILKRASLAAILMMSFNANAATWILLHQEFVGQGYACTYQLQFSQYQTTIFSPTFCQYMIYR